MSLTIGELERANRTVAALERIANAQEIQATIASQLYDLTKQAMTGVQIDLGTVDAKLHVVDAIKSNA